MDGCDCVSFQVVYLLQEVWIIVFAVLADRIGDGGRGYPHLLSKMVTLGIGHRFSLGEFDAGLRDDRVEELVVLVAQVWTDERIVTGDKVPGIKCEIISIIGVGRDLLVFPAGRQKDVIDIAGQIVCSESPTPFAIVVDVAEGLEASVSEYRLVGRFVGDVFGDDHGWCPPVGGP